MANYYVSPTGNNASAGTSAGTAWATATKSLSSGAGPTGADVIYLAPGNYREVVPAALTSPGSELKIVGDITGANHGVTGGLVGITPYLTNDSTLPSTTATLDLAGKSNLTFENIIFHGGSGTTAYAVKATTAGSANITFRNCAFQSSNGSSTLVNFTGTAGAAANWLFERCTFIVATDTGINITLPTVAGADYDAAFQVLNSLFLCGTCIVVTASGALANKGGGVLIRNCTGYGNRFVNVSSANNSTSIPCKVENSIGMVSAFSAVLQANTSGQLTEDYNLLCGSSVRSNVTAGAHSISNVSYALSLDLGYGAQMGMQPRPFMTPLPSSLLLGFGNAAGAPTVDFLNRTRPEGGGSTSAAIGYLERHDTAQKETGTVRTGANAINITGPGSQEFSVPVDATSTTVTVYARYDSTHAATNKPQMMLLNGEECGVTAATATMSAAVDTWENLSLTFTPTAKGIVTLRLVSRAAGGSGKAFFDDFNIA